ncbi:uncharacterized protein PHACADRAFT_257853 [Phanerochaete carnosa HHB-10118-sp]|uniref:Uncharacterized protein n=1 Tax=Phanerochaete carnosa (strain HHB-10118-sp) TaxID=650164 RepID=K5WUP6_PHACS|nr:uncharacterized protein PHACADRAFT_257853 [Phanerochaete carnosa HHB-10118-sp]EKM54187.1 hypothetical protein PHACADRAFT_257853 [Phanerochaete carnosa HHB-10118-sp]
MVFGGLGIMLYGGESPLLAWDKMLDKVDVQSTFFATVLMIVILVLAYLTNPSETSFRTYLTEQSFRQHLSRLEGDNQDDQSDSSDSGVHFTLSRSRQAPQKGSSSYNSTPPFRFNSRATVSLRTPKHVFYSFGIMTIAAVLPTGRSGSKGRSIECSGFMVSESWFIGAFGKWWRGGPIQSWWIDSVANNKDAERCSSGILDMKAFDGLECYEGMSMNQSAQLSRDSTQKFRSTERSMQRTASSSHRSTTPPPLPKSASLPLHVQRQPSDKAHNQRHAQAPSQPSVTPAPTPSAVLNPPQLNPSPSTLFDQSPVISEILRQISTSKAAVYELRSQLSEAGAQAQESHAAIQSDLGEHRARKREEDAARQELKARTKTLEDSKRSAESCRRDTEKRLRAAESARNSASERIERLDKEIGALKERVGRDEDAIVRCKTEADEAEKGLIGELEKKRKEIKVAEDVVAALNSRTKELEEKIAAEEQRLKRAKEQAELRKQDRDFYPLHVVNPQEAATTWSPIVTASNLAASDVHDQINTDGAAQIEVFPTALHFPVVQGRRASVSEEPQGFSTSPRPRHLSLGGISNFRECNGINIQEPAHPQIVLRPPAVHDDLPTSKSSSQSQSSRFSPFTDNELEVPAFDNQGPGISPRSTSLIPTSLIKSLEAGGVSDDLSRSFQSDNDAILDRDWRKMHTFPSAAVESPGVFNSSPTSLTCPSFDGVDREDPFEIRPPPPPIRHRITSDGVDTERTFHNVRTSSEPQPLTRSRTRESDNGEKVVGHRRWFSTPRETKDKKGLNPEAKVFQFKKTFPMFGGHASAAKHSPYDSLSSEPSSFTSSLSVPSIFVPPSSDSDSAFSTLSMRAFAPSPAEREALARAAGTSTNTSLERLPTLSEIGSMPPSPNHVHAIAAATAQQHSPPHALVDHGAGARSLLAPGLAWLNALPRMRKAKFSPWEDEADTEGEAR